MAKLKYLSIALIAATTLATPAMARSALWRHAAVDAYASTVQIDRYGAPSGCVPAPRVGAFASDPWTNNVPCAPYAYPAY